ncbi:guanine nucleotide exchange factor synembryn-domain-containing protein [Dendryphion nanum]|uniref:Guanine nucleotide exchange factor synembryn-domain-containing protein n=1 Tax=Dendryphion nanum TaxID=256645 RepID=A0A9P9EDK8_9PLEO|nr:guanine nucleotide exchange factor synembryn-domain-containing protein [Dendryphion nanum]
MLARYSSQVRGGKAKLEEVTDILSKLKADLDTPKLAPKERKQLLEELKVHGRSVEDADPIFVQDGIQTLCRYAFEGNDLPSSQEALRCIANALLLKPSTRQILVNLGYAPKAAMKLRVCQLLPLQLLPRSDSPVNYLVNALINLDLEDKKGQQLKFHGMNAVFPKFDQKCNAEHLINILDSSIVAYTESELDNTIAPVLTLIRRIYEIAPESVKKYMEILLLPTDEERTRPLGKSDTLSSRLLQLSTSAMTPSLRGSISAMMFELSGKDATQFVHNVGYGFASGFLISNNIQMPENAMEAHATADPEKAIPVNPITGQRVDMEEPDQSEPMTEEEKEREAERLFVLFERLKATGVMDVRNPVEEAYRTGRIEELPDDAD